jgi:DNA-binding NtrC family response regulator
MNDQAEVLVLDDEEVVCERLKSHLEKSSYKVETFTESQAAIHRLAEKEFDVVVTDLKMKGPTGLDVLQFVQSRAGTTQVILITGYASIEASREAEYRGVYRFVEKPFRLEDIGRLVKKAAKEAKKLRDRART